MNIKELIDYFEEVQKSINLIPKKVNQDFNSLNLFKLISNQYKKENFHSDIIVALFNYKESLNDGKTILQTFIEYVNKGLSKKNVRINYANFKYNEIIREKKRIDITILGKSLKSDKFEQAIIIENKINGAPDQPKQIPRYYQNLIEDKKLISAIIYLPLTGINLPYQEDWEENIIKRINPKLLTLPAYSDKLEKLSIYNWLKSIEKDIKNKDCQFIVKQYLELLKEIGRNTMKLEEMKSFLDYLNQDENHNKVNELIRKYNQLPEYQAKQIKESYEDFLREFYSKVSDVWENKSQQRWILKFENPRDNYKKIPAVLRFSFNKDNSKIHLWGNVKGDANLDKIISFVKKLDGEFEINPKDNPSEFVYEFSFPDQWVAMNNYIKETLINKLKETVTSN